MISKTHNTIPMLTVEQYKRYHALQRRLHGNPGQLGVEDITMEKLKRAYQQDLDTLFADGWSSASITNNTRQFEQALLVLFYC